MRQKTLNPRGFGVFLFIVPLVVYSRAVPWLLQGLEFRLLRRLEKGLQQKKTLNSISPKIMSL